MDDKLSTVEWDLWRGDEIMWDSHLCKYSDHNIYQSSLWARHKEKTGWLSMRLVGNQGQNTVTIAQILFRLLPFQGRLVWIPGGPIGMPEKWGSGLFKAIKDKLNVPWLYVRINNFYNFQEHQTKELLRNHWIRPRKYLSSDQSLLYNLNNSEEERYRQLGSNWARNYRRSKKFNHNTDIWKNPDPLEICDLYNQMKEYKKFKNSFNEQEIQSIIKNLSNNLVIIYTRNSKSELISIRGALIQENKAWDILAATNLQGRKEYASYATFWFLTLECQKLGVKVYDLSGVNPTRNKGVYDFKKGTGATSVRYIGEWEKGGTLFRTLINLGLHFQNG